MNVNISYILNILPSSTCKDINLLFLFLSPILYINVLISPFILGNISTSGFKTSSKEPIKY